MYVHTGWGVIRLIGGRSGAIWKIVEGMAIGGRRYKTTQNIHVLLPCCLTAWFTASPIRPLSRIPDSRFHEFIMTHQTKAYVTAPTIRLQVDARTTHILGRFEVLAGHTKHQPKRSKGENTSKCHDYIIHPCPAKKKIEWNHCTE